jgi:hypothetical protein
MLAAVIGCPAICHDEIKEGMAHATPGLTAAPGDELTQRTLPVFFGMLNLLIRAGVTTVAEAAFQDHVWRPRLEPLRDLARIRVVHCAVGAEAAHRAFRPVRIDAPALEVDTGDGYHPSFGQILSFIETGLTRDFRRPSWPRDQAERVPGRVRVDAFAVEFPRAQGQYPRACRGHVLYHHVEMHLLRPGRVRPGRRLVAGGELEG